MNWFKNNWGWILFGIALVALCCEVLWYLSHEGSRTGARAIRSAESGTEILSVAAVPASVNLAHYGDGKLASRLIQ